MNLQNLFELQKKLDEHIEKKHPRKEGEDRLSKKILALQVELAECAQESRCFKFWSKDQEPRIGIPSVHYDENLGHDVVEYIGPNALLEEYVDCLHFILSIGLELDFTDIDILKVKESNITNQFIECFGKIYSMHFQKRVNGEVPREMYELLFAYFIGLGEMIGFTWNQVEQGYLNKNNINHQRQEENY